MHKHVLELQQKTRKMIQGLCLFSFFSRLFISLFVAKEVDSVHSMFFPLLVNFDMCSNE